MYISMICDDFVCSRGDAADKRADTDTERFSSSSLTAYDFHIYVKDD